MIEFKNSEKGLKEHATQLKLQFTLFIYSITLTFTILYCIYVDIYSMKKVQFFLYSNLSRRRGTVTLGLLAEFYCNKNRQETNRHPSHRHY